MKKEFKKNYKCSKKKKLSLIKIIFKIIKI